jgi:hypothetical protein
MDGSETLQDDPTIPDSELLYRGIHAVQIKEGNEVSSGAFISGTNPHPSVDLSSLSTPEETHRRRPSDAGVIKLVTGTVRAYTPGVVRKPEDDNPAHALIIRDCRLTHGQWKEVARTLAKASVWIITPRK